MKRQEINVRINFSIKWTALTGKSIYLTGNIPQLGQWQIEQAVKLNQSCQDIWSISINILQFSRLQYKYFMTSSDKIIKNEIIWEKTNKKHLLNIQQSTQNFPQTSICSFNIRYLTPKDTNENHWDSRKIRIVQYINSTKYDLIGVQQATRPQRKYLQKSLENYEYIGRERNLSKDQQCGIFVKRDKYVILQNYCYWISQSKKQEQIGYDGKHARHFTSLLAAPKVVSNMKKIPCLLIINLHFDHKGKQAKINGIKQVIQKCIETKNKLQNDTTYMLIGCIIMGDFNIREGNKMLKLITNDERMPLKSMRSIQGADKSFTYNAFQKEKMLKIGQFVEKNQLTIDHMYYWLNKETKLAYLRFKVDKCIDQNFLSDHYAIIGQFAIQTNCLEKPLI